MSAVRWICALALIALSNLTIAGTAEGVSVSHFEPLQRVVLHRRGAVVEKLRPSESMGLRFEAMGRSFDLELEPNARLLAAQHGLSVDNRLGVYRGVLAGVESSWARIVMAGGEPRGLIWDGREMFAVEAGDDSALTTTETVIYRLADVTVAAGEMSCGTSHVPSSGAAVYDNIVSELKVMAQQGPGATEEIRIAVVADAAFTNAQGSVADARAAIATRMNNLDGIYSQQLAVQVTADQIDPFTDANDPFTAETDSGLLLDEVAAYRVQTPAQTQRGLTHLMTGKNLDGTTAGVAYVGALCSTRFGAGLAEARRGATIDSLISAHEIGHNFGASHDGDPAESCPNEPPTFIMAPSVSVANNSFSPCSVGVMQAEAATASCITPLANVDMAISANGQPSSVLLGNAINLTFDLNNLGTEVATGVEVNVALPTNVTFLAASASQGSCTNSGADVDCSLGMVAGGGSGTVTVTTTSDSAGQAQFVGTVAADADANAGNNQVTVPVNVDAAVDLVVNTGAAVQVRVNESTNVVATLENESPVAATDVAVSVTLDAGVRADSANWSAGTCTVSAQSVDCSAATLSAQSMSTLTIAVTGVTVGTQAYTISMTANEADSMPANDSAAGSVTVTTPSSSGGGSGGGSGNNDDEGGGATGLWFLAMLGGLAIRRRLPA